MTNLNVELEMKAEQIKKELDEQSIIEQAKNWTLDDIKKELKKVQSQKCRLKKQQSKPTYDTEITEVLRNELKLQIIRDTITMPKKTVTTLTKEEINALTYDETVKAIKSIQSKKSNNRFNQESDEYKSAVKIEELLIAHRNKNKPLAESVVSKKELIDLIENLENANAKKQEWIDALKELTKTTEQ